MMKYYIGYYNKPWDKSEFTVIAGSPDPFVALFILDSYREKCPESMKALLVKENPGHEVTFKVQ